jgi:aromatic-L-amino-acid decarboxylase
MPQESLDPDDWSGLRALAHRMVDDAIDYSATLRDRPVWQPMPDAARAAFAGGLPQQGRGIDAVYDDLTTYLLPYPMGNIHPRFWAWYMGSSNLTGALGDFLAAVLGSNLGGGNHAATLIDAQVVEWCKEMTGFPASASGTLVSGGSVANLICLTVARNVMSGVDLRQEGLAALDRPMRFYGSDQIHSCHQKAVETLGLGNRALRRIPSHTDCTMDVAALRRAIDQDRADGWHPACVIATAGTVNTGAIDDLTDLAALCREQGLWLHVDGCIGALIALAPRNGAKVQGIGLADSLALDPHKLLHAPFEVGCALVRDSKAHVRTFTLTPEYLAHTVRGVAAGDWLFDYGLQTSRGFRALKVWMAVQEQGAAKFGRLIDQTIDLAAHLAAAIDANPVLERTAPVTLNIVCFRFDPGGQPADGLERLNIEIMLRLQEQGIAVISDTRVKGHHCLRVAIANHRTQTRDLDLLLAQVQRIGREVMAETGGLLEQPA